MAPTSGVVVKSFNSGVLVFNMLINGKVCDVMFDTDSTVNILGKETLSGFLGIPIRFIQVKAGQVKAIQGIAGQKISNIGNVQLNTELLGHNSAKFFVVLPNTSFGAEAVLNHKRTAVCLQLEDETSLSNLDDFTVTTSPSVESMPAEITSTSVECMPMVGAYHESLAPSREIASVKREPPIPSVNRRNKQGELHNHDNDVVLSVPENENGQTTTASGKIDVSIIALHATVGNENGTDNLEESED